MNNFSFINKWIDSEVVNYMWGGPTFKYPIMYEDFEKHVSREDIFPYLLLVDNTVSGYGELVKVDNESYRISRVYIDKSIRGKGLCTKLIRELVEMAKGFGAEIIYLSVFEVNTPALKCYEKCGFRTYEVDNKTRFFGNEILSLIKMKYEVY